MTDQGRCRRRDPRGHQCELPAGHGGDHQRQPPPFTWPEWVGGDATEGKGYMLECTECGDERTEDRLKPIDWGVGLGLCCCSAEVHVTRHELDSVHAERDEARDCAIRQHQLLCRLLPDEVTRTAVNLWPWLSADQNDETAPDGEQR